MRYVIPRFDGEETVPNLAHCLEDVLKKFEAFNVRVHKGHGVLTFRLPESADWFEFCNELTKVHPNCIAWSYRTLAKEDADRRGTGHVCWESLNQK